MSAHDLLNFLNKFGKDIKCEVLPSISSLFSFVFNKFNNTGAWSVRFYLSYDTNIILRAHF